MTTTADLAVHRSVTVTASLERAFAVFTESFAAWWPAHSINPNGYAGAFIEPRVGGRWYEQAPDGSQCDWGSVLAWDPPQRVLLSWQLNGEFAYDPDPAHASEVEVRFSPHGCDAHGSELTRVDLIHRHFDRVVGAEQLHRDVGGDGGGWGSIMLRYAAVVEGREPPLP